MDRIEPNWNYVSNWFKLEIENLGERIDIEFWILEFQLDIVKRIFFSLFKLRWKDLFHLKNVKN